ncbi:MAG TPA: fatty acid--CoA ligase family protein [Verrucomicrobiae bacterium]
MSSQFLYERWLATVRTYANETALTDFTTPASPIRWTFSQLFQAAESPSTRHLPPPSSQSAICNLQSAIPSQFLLALLNSWRSGLITCPLESNQSAPDLSQLAHVPPDIAHLKLTSGTSAAAKCIAFTGPQLAADAANIVSTMRLTPEAPNLACISLAHSYGFSNLILPLLLHGIPLILLPAPLPELLLRAAAQFKSVTLPAVPALWKTWLQSNSIPPNTRIAISAGAPLPLDLERTIYEKSNLKIHNFYGSSECGGIAYDRTETPRTAPNLAGTALDNVTLSLSDAGTLIVSSPAVGQTYLPEPQPRLQPGRFETSDLAEIRNGSVYLQGRATDLLNIAGRKASPDAIEAILRTHPAVLECIVFGIQNSDLPADANLPISNHSEGGARLRPSEGGAWPYHKNFLPSSDRADTVVAVVNTKERIPISTLTEFLSQKLPPWQIPRRWWFTDSLAPNHRGKIPRLEWKRRYLEQSPD